MKKLSLVILAVLLLMLVGYAVGTKLNKSQKTVTSEAHKTGPTARESKPEQKAPPEIFKNPVLN